jgi:hypothetical protein
MSIATGVNPSFLAEFHTHTVMAAKAVTQAR